ncbi:MAG: alpha/beta hydrolase fold domain-containing protein [Treponemataceae bacterium]
MKIVDRKSAIKKLKTLIFTQKSEPFSFRSQLEKAFKSTFIPNGVAIKEIEIGRMACDYLQPEVSSLGRSLVYVHGGSFVGGSRKSYRSFCASIANASSSGMYLPEFHLAPENPFPAAIEDIISLIKQISDKEIVICADNSGASIALACIYSLPCELKKRIKKLVLFSPWLDFSVEAPVFNQKKAFDEVLSAESLRRCADVYTYRSNLKNPLVSPVFAGEKELENFPHVYIQIGEKELLKDQIRVFAHLLFSNGVECIVDEVPNMMSMFQMADEFLPEAHLAVEKVGKYIQGL